MVAMVRADAVATVRADAVATVAIPTVAMVVTVATEDEVATVRADAVATARAASATLTLVTDGEQSDKVLKWMHIEQLYFLNLCVLSFICVKVYSNHTFLLSFQSIC